jgi:hypothetical protein
MAEIYRISSVGDLGCDAVCICANVSEEAAAPICRPEARFDIVQIFG